MGKAIEMEMPNRRLNLGNEIIHQMKAMANKNKNSPIQIVNRIKSA